MGILDSHTWISQMSLSQWSTLRPKAMFSLCLDIREQVQTTSEGSSANQLHLASCLGSCWGSLSRQLFQMFDGLRHLAQAQRVGQVSVVLAEDVPMWGEPITVMKKEAHNPTKTQEQNRIKNSLWTNFSPKAPDLQGNNFHNLKEKQQIQPKQQTKINW